WGKPVDSFQGAAMSGVAFAGGRWVAVGAGGSVYTSPPGTGPWNWSRSCCGTTNLAGGAFNPGGNGWVTVGDRGRMYTTRSPDTSPWSTVANSGFGTIDIAAVASNGTNIWVPVGARARISTSTDGTTWTIISGG